MGLLSSPTLAIGEHVIMDDGELEGLVTRAAEGETAAWGALWEGVEPWLEKLVANPRFLGRVGQRDGDLAHVRRRRRELPQLVTGWKVGGLHG